MVQEGIRHFVKIMKHDVPDAKRVLVVGCGYSASEVFSLAEALPEIYTVGFDINLDPQLENVQTERYQITRGDACAMHFPDASFDVVFYHHVIEHVPCPEQSLAECARVLKNNGYLYCGTPNRSRLIGYIGSSVSLKKKFPGTLLTGKCD